MSIYKIPSSSYYYLEPAESYRLCARKTGRVGIATSYPTTPGTAPVQKFKLQSFQHFETVLVAQSLRFVQDV